MSGSQRLYDSRLGKVAIKKYGFSKHYLLMDVYLRYMVLLMYSVSVPTARPEMGEQETFGWRTCAQHRHWSTAHLVHPDGQPELGRPLCAPPVFADEVLQTFETLADGVDVDVHLSGSCRR